MRIILHIGVHKTGTSALQAFLLANASQLAERGVSYDPPSPKWPNHHPLALKFRPATYKAGDGPSSVRKLLERAAGKTVLISSEMLCEHETDIEQFLSCFSGHAIEVIAYIRHPADIVISAFNEMVRHYESKWSRSVNSEPFAYHPSQLPVLERWLKQGGIELTLAPYDMRQWPGGSLFRDFIRMIGLDEEGLDYSQREENKSIPHILAETLRILNGLNPSKEQLDGFVKGIRTLVVNDDTYPLGAQQVEVCLGLMRSALPTYRPFYRKGFDERFLLEPRPATSLR